MNESVEKALICKGIHLYGVCSFGEVKDRLLPCRALSRLPTNPQSIIVCLFPYKFSDDSPRNLSRYACVPDYHRVVGATLDEVSQQLSDVMGYTFTAFVDNSPIPEVFAAAKAGLGVIGDNGLLIHERFGTYVFIGTIVTDAVLDAADKPIKACLHCGKCVNHCPTNALTDGQSSPIRHLCLSDISQKKGELSPKEIEQLRENGLIWGCDRCQEVCPLNEDTICEPFVGFDLYSPWLYAIPAIEKLKEQPYGWRGREVLERNWRILYPNE